MATALLDMDRPAKTAVLDSPFGTDFLSLMEIWRAGRAGGAHAGPPPLARLDQGRLTAILPALAIIAETPGSVQYRLAGGGMEQFHGRRLHGSTLTPQDLGPDQVALLTTLASAQRHGLPVLSISAYGGAEEGVEIHRLALPLAVTAGQPRLTLLAEFYVTRGDRPATSDRLQGMMDPARGRFSLVTDPQF